jgi:hypothetical protein
MHRTIAAVQILVLLLAQLQFIVPALAKGTYLGGKEAVCGGDCTACGCSVDKRSTGTCCCAINKKKHGGSCPAAERHKQSESETVFFSSCPCGSAEIIFNGFEHEIFTIHRYVIKHILSRYTLGIRCGNEFASHTNEPPVPPPEHSASS